MIAEPIAAITSKARRARMITVALALVVGIAAIGSQIALVDELTPDSNSPIYPTPTEKPEVLLNAHDGKFFAAIAADPLLDHPDRIGPEIGERASRPLWSWLAWIISLGQRDHIAWSLMALTAISVACLVAAILALSSTRGEVPVSAVALGIFGAPGVLALIAFPGLNDAMGATLAIAGFALWKRDKVGLAIASFAAAGLCHEALLICPLAVLIDEWVVHRRTREAVRWLLPFVPYVAWVVFVRVRASAWPTGSSSGNLGLPFAGFATSVIHRWHPLDACCFALILLAGVVAWIKLRDTAFRLTLLGFGVLATLLGPYIWARWVDFGRALLPVCALAVVAITSPTNRDTPPNRRPATAAQGRHS